MMLYIPNQHTIAASKVRTIGIYVNFADLHTVSALPISESQPKETGSINHKSKNRQFFLKETINRPPIIRVIGGNRVKETHQRKATDLIETESRKLIKEESIPKFFRPEKPFDAIPGKKTDRSLLSA